jgi:hypothetical protein
MSSANDEEVPLKRVVPAGLFVGPAALDSVGRTGGSV